MDPNDPLAPTRPIPDTPGPIDPPPARPAPPPSRPAAPRAGTSGDQKMGEALKHRNASAQADSGEEATRHLKQAETLLLEAIADYKRDLTADPDNKALQRKLQKAGEQLYWVRKNQRL